MSMSMRNVIHIALLITGLASVVWAVPEDDLACPPNEAYSKCKSICNDCRNRGNCRQTICEYGCDCIPGYYRDEYDICIPEEQCVFHYCPPNEMPTDCMNPCNDCFSRGNCNYMFCSEGCDCVPGFRRNASNFCIPEQQCPKPTASLSYCKPNEKYYQCMPSCHTTCDDFYIDGPCTEYCQPGCFCKDGLVRDTSGACIHPGQCPRQPLCGLNEEYSPCVIPCNNCKSRGRCEYFLCNEGCDCRPNFYRNASGICVPEEFCPRENCGLNEVYAKCVNPCNTCADRRNCKFYDCKPGCDCAEGFFRNESLVCVPEQQCPPEFKCLQDEQYYTCIPDCVNTCLNHFNPNIACSKTCTPGCFCRQGLLRNSRGKCVAPNMCDEVRCASRNEMYYTCKPVCDQSCDSRDSSVSTYQCSTVCVAGCYCKPGLFKRRDGQCVPPNQCKITERCQLNEEFYQCIPNCNNTCENFNRSDVPCLLICKPGCFCKKGLVRKLDGSCVSPTECENRQCRPDEEYSTCGTCEKSCDNYDKPVICTQECKVGCFCKAGTVRNAQGACVPPKTCPPQPCGVNEVRSECGTCAKTCSNMDDVIICAQVCLKGCFCQEGFVRNATRACIPPSQCPITPCGQNEISSNCSRCPVTCDNIDLNIPCNEKCRRGCVCRPGFVKNRDDLCIPLAECPRPTCNINEVFSNCSRCPVTCDNLNEKLICTEECKRGCVCQEGLVRNRNGVCIPATQCPPTNCSENEVFLNCGRCPRSCNNFRTEIICTELCKRGCFCRVGFVRDNGICIPFSQCPQISCGENEEFSLCGRCPRTCDNMGRNEICTAVCRMGCFCKSGFVRNQNGVCVMPNQCPQRCPDGEVFQICSCIRTCDNITSSCSQQNCMSGCFCPEGSVRSRSGTCIPIRQCERECRSDETFYPCKPDCRNTCENNDRPGLTCPEECRPGCYCRQGLLKRKDGRCVIPDDCFIESCLPDETFYKCKPDCRNTCENFNKPNSFCPAKCQRGCFCRPGLVKRGDGKCVLPFRCENSCQSDQQYYICMPNCINTCRNFHNPSPECPEFCKPGCFCRQGLVLRSSDRMCTELSLCGILSGILGRSGLNGSDVEFANFTASSKVTDLTTTTVSDEMSTSSNLSGPSGISGRSGKASNDNEFTNTSRSTDTTMLNSTIIPTIETVSTKESNNLTVVTVLDAETSTPAINFSTSAATTPLITSTNAEATNSSISSDTFATTSPSISTSASTTSIPKSNCRKPTRNRGKRPGQRSGKQPGKQPGPRSGKRSGNRPGKNNKRTTAASAQKMSSIIRISTNPASNPPMTPSISSTIKESGMTKEEFRTNFLTTEAIQLKTSSINTAAKDESASGQNKAQTSEMTTTPINSSQTLESSSTVTILETLLTTQKDIPSSVTKFESTDAITQDDNQDIPGENKTSKNKFVTSTSTSISEKRSESTNSIASISPNIEKAEDGLSLNTVTTTTSSLPSIKMTTQSGTIIPSTLSKNEQDNKSNSVPIPTNKEMDSESFSTISVLNQRPQTPSTSSVEQPNTTSPSSQSIITKIPWRTESTISPLPTSDELLSTSTNFTNDRLTTLTNTARPATFTNTDRPATLTNTDRPATSETKLESSAIRTVSITSPLSIKSRAKHTVPPIILISTVNSSLTNNSTPDNLPLTTVNTEINNSSMSSTFPISTIHSTLPPIVTPTRRGPRRKPSVSRRPPPRGGQTGKTKPKRKNNTALPTITTGSSISTVKPSTATLITTLTKSPIVTTTHDDDQIAIGYASDYQSSQTRSDNSSTPMPNTTISLTTGASATNKSTNTLITQQFTETATGIFVTSEPPIKRSEPRNNTKQSGKSLIALPTNKTRVDLENMSSTEKSTTLLTTDFVTTIPNITISVSTNIPTSNKSTDPLTEQFTDVTIENFTET